MASRNRLSATVPERHREEINNISQEREIKDADAEREVVRAGLEKLGRIEETHDPGSGFLQRARQSGMLLGFVGVTVIGYGLFGSAAFRYIGFGLVLSGFALIAGAEFAPRVNDLIDETLDNRGEEPA